MKIIKDVEEKYLQREPFKVGGVYLHKTFNSFEEEDRYNLKNNDEYYMFFRAEDVKGWCALVNLETGILFYTRTVEEDKFNKEFRKQFTYIPNATLNFE